MPPSPETDADRLYLLDDFGERVEVSPASGARGYTLQAIVNLGPRVADLGIDHVARVDVSGSEPHLFLRALDADENGLAPGDRVELPSQRRRHSTYRISRILPDEQDADYLNAYLLEA